MENREIARLLFETADLMEIAAEDGFRIRSYRNAASVIEGYPESIYEIVRNPERKVTDVSGIGKGLAGVLKEIAERGSFEKHDQMLEKYPPSALELLKIQGLGPKSIALLFEHYRVSTVDDLERICREQKLRELPRMGAKLEEKVLKSIAQYRQSAGRYILSFGHRVAAELIEYLKETPGVERITAAGSLRRGRETIGDLDLLATGPGGPEALERFTKHPRVHDVLGHGVNKASVRFGLEGIQVDLRALPAENYGAALQYFTGSKEHNVNIRGRALKLGMTLNEYGLVRLADNVKVAGETEEGIYAALGLPWIAPELRENCGEIEAALEGRLPKLIDMSDIRGDLHMHTTATDGRASVREMAEAAAALGYEYIAITDHSKALAMANGLDEKRVVEFAAEVRQLNQDGLPIRVFSGIECDILRDGSMDLAESALAELDVVVGSIHSHLALERAEMTERYLRALESPNLRIVGHATGRRLLQREGFEFDFDAVASRAAERKIWLEVNSSPERLDISAPLIRSALQKGCKFTLSTDSHRPEHLSHIRFGLMMARRGYLTAADVVNTYSLPAFENVLRSR